MADILVAHLNKKSGDHAALKTLVSQWDFDSKLIPKALQAVGNLFPHYSRHDESHSRQILINIERLLGESISLLTATDTWLILEAAYWHDIGMVVPKKDLAQELEREEFQDFLAELRQAPQHDLFRFASTFDPTNLAGCFLGADTPADAVSRFNELMAEWFRRKHPARSQAMVNDPWSTASISSPRTELMPARLFRLLGRICHMHGVSFEEILSADGLPFKEAGMANEDCHPRFVACLLRMGDLLDLDDNRFCPVLQRIAGDDRLAMSRAHEDKHHAIRHLRIDRDRIEVSAECQTIPGYLEAFRWFDWLKEETQSQMAHWQEIAPNRELGLLPTLGNLTVTLSGDLQVLQKGERPQFRIDEKSVVGLLQGSNLYNSAFPCIRELLQNAVDATLLGIWAKEAPHKSADRWVLPGAREQLRTASPVQVELIEISELGGNAETTDWLLRISDGGTGISSGDLLHMLRIGGSQKNVVRQRLIRAMPEWMKPSGAFGIGLQSAFLLSDCIHLKTKSIFSNETLELELHSPLGRNEGLVLVRRVPNDVAQRYGTTLEIKFRLDRFAKRWSLPGSLRDDDSVATQLVMSMDPILDETFHYDAGKIVDEVVAFGKNSLVGVRCTFSRAAGGCVTLSATSESTGELLFLPDAQGHCVEFKYHPNLEYFASSGSRFMYRGQPFKCDAARFPYVGFEINLLSGAAGTWLSANRDQLIPKAVGEIEAVVLSALTQAVEADIKRYSDGFLVSPEHSAALSLFTHAMALHYGDPWKSFAAETGDAWKDVPVIGTSIRECFAKSEWLLDEFDANNSVLDQCDVSVARHDAGAVTTLARLAWKKEKNGSVQVLSVSEIERRSDTKGVDLIVPAGVDKISLDAKPRRPVLRFSLAEKPQYSSMAFADHLIRAINSLVNRRYLVEITDERWQFLALKKDVDLFAWHLMGDYADGPIMLLPYLFSGSQVQLTQSQLERLCKHVQPLLANQQTVDEVQHSYEDLVNYIDNEIMVLPAYAARWQKARSGEVAEVQARRRND